LLIELMRHESPPSDRTCTVCNSTLGTYRCIDCFGPHLLCSVCCVSAHSNSPFHWIQRFNGQHFERADLDELGLVIDVRYHMHKCTPGNPHMEDVYTESDFNISDDNDDDDDILLYHGSGERIPVGFNTGNPRVGFSDTAPVPVYTVPCFSRCSTKPAVPVVPAGSLLVPHPTTSR
jgi:hypothetical protein